MLDNSVMGVNDLVGLCWSRGKEIIVPGVDDRVDPTSVSGSIPYP